MDQTESAVFYVTRINSNKHTGRLFGCVKYTMSIPFVTMLTISFLFASLETLFPTFFLSFAPCLIICLELYRVTLLRNAMIDRCLLDDRILQNDINVNGVDPNFPYDPLYVDDIDRKYIFEDALIELKRSHSIFWKKWGGKKILFVTLIALLYGIFYLSLSFIQGNH
jgi:hypothetical protein